MEYKAFEVKAHDVEVFNKSNDHYVIKLFVKANTAAEALEKAEKHIKENHLNSVQTLVKLSPCKVAMIPLKLQYYIKDGPFILE